jgi:hypothetical protein
MTGAIDPPDEVLDAIFSGLKVSRSWLGGAVAVPVARRRRDGDGWPALVVAARIDGPRFQSSIGLWAADDDGARVAPIDDVARSWSQWSVHDTHGDRNVRSRLPECDEAVRALAVSTADQRPPSPHRH